MGEGMFSRCGGFSERHYPQCQAGDSRIHEEELGGFDQAFPEVARPGRKCLDKKNGLKQIKISAQGAVGAEREWSFL